LDEAYMKLEERERKIASQDNEKLISTLKADLFSREEEIKYLREEMGKISQFQVTY
jgi:hypothetical protein